MADIISWADAAAPGIRDSYLQAARAAANLVTVDEFTDLIARNDINALYRLATRLIDQGFWQEGSSAFVSALTQAGVAPLLAAGTLALPLTRALDILRLHAATMVTNISLETMTNLRTILSAGHRSGIGARAMGRQMRNSLGLLPTHQAALSRYHRKMINDGLDLRLIARNHETYRRRLLSWRAENIARTESISAAHGGQVLAWLEGMSEGTLPASARVRWMVSEDDRLCERCAPMDGQTSEVGGVFTAKVKGYPDGLPTAQGPGSRRRRKSGLRPGTMRPEWRHTWLDGATVALASPIVVPWPPLHPSCRCTLVLVT